MAKIFAYVEINIIILACESICATCSYTSNTCNDCYIATNRVLSYNKCVC